MKNHTTISDILFHDEMDIPCNPSSPPIFQTTSFHYDTFDELKRAMHDEQASFLYTRGRNPTVEQFEKKIAKLENAERAKLFGSGIAAVVAANKAFLEAGDHIVAVSDCYSWTNRFFAHYIRRFNIEVTFVSGETPEEWDSAARRNTKIFFLESPTTFSLKLQDIEAITTIAKKRNVRTIIDNSWATPLYQNPIEYGVDIVVHSCTKYISGHNDVLGGVVAGREEDIDWIYKTEFMNTGAIASPFESWLLLRGLRTLPVRLAHQSNSARRIVEFLNAHPKVNVRYPLHESHPQFKLAKKQLSGGSSVFTIDLDVSSLLQIEQFINALEYFKKTIGWGGYESLVLPAGASGSCPDKYLYAIRLYIGLEDPELLMEDLSNALNALD